MIPYFELPALHLPLGLKIDVGVVSAIAVGLGSVLAARAARKYAPGNDQPMRDFVTWAVLGGLYGGHFMHLFAYHPEEITGIGSILRFWDGLSSMGGVLGALVGIFAYFRKIKTPVTPWLDALALGATPAWMVARIGCFLVHDHPGVRTDFFLAVNFPVDKFGGPRHDLGLYDAIALGLISTVLYTLARYRPRQGRIMGTLAILYSMSRFFLDTLRATDLSYVDKRYAGFTPAQFVVVGLFVTGIWLWLRKTPEATLTVPASGKGGGNVGRK